MLKLQADIAREAAPEQPGAGLRGANLAQVSVDEGGRWPIGRRVLAVLALGALAWLAVLLLPGLVNDLVGFLLGLLLQAIA